MDEREAEERPEEQPLTGQPEPSQEAEPSMADSTRESIGDEPTPAPDVVAAEEAEGVTGNAEEVTEAAEQLTEAAEDLSKAAGQLAEAAEELSEACTLRSRPTSSTLWTPGPGAPSGPTTGTFRRTSMPAAET